MRLGLKLPDPNKLRASFKARAFIDLSRINVPDVVDWSQKVSGYGLYNNDRFGCCGPAGCANLVRQWTANDGTQVDLPQTAVDRAYMDVGEWNGRDSGQGTDGGVDPIRLMDYWRKVGIGGRKIAAWLTIDPNDTKLVDACLYLFGGLAIGFNMPAAWQNEIGAVWKGPRDPSRPPRGYEPGGWGGHFVVGAKAEGEDWDVITWGKRQRVSALGFRAYCMFLAVAVSPDWLGPDNKAPNGFDGDLLMRDLAHIEAGKPLEERPSTTDPQAVNRLREYVIAGAKFAGAHVETMGNKDTLTW